MHTPDSRDLEPNRNNPQRGGGYWLGWLKGVMDGLRPYLVRALGGILIAISLYVSHYLGVNRVPIDQRTLNQARGQINRPHNGEDVDSCNKDPKVELPCSGTIDVDPGGLHYWLAVETDGLIWFKESELKINSKEWKASFRECGTSPNFSITLFAVNDSANSYITAWQNDGAIHNGKYSDLRWVRGANRLDRVDVRKIEFK
jgi:hypothetical protein